MLFNNCCSPSEGALRGARVGRYQELQCSGMYGYSTAAVQYTMSTSLSSASCPCPHRTWQDGQGHSYLDERIRLPQYRDLGTRQSLQTAATAQIAQARAGVAVGACTVHSNSNKAERPAPAQLAQKWPAVPVTRTTDPWHERPQLQLTA